MHFLKEKMKSTVKILGLLIVGSIVWFPTLTRAELSGSLAKEAIASRLKPIGNVSVDSSGSDSKTTAAQPKGPEKIYADNCKMCHNSGLAGAPKWGKKKDWATRLGQGIDSLTQRAYDGFKAMPPKGNCIKCSKEELKDTIQYVLDNLK